MNKTILIVKSYYQCLILLFVCFVLIIPNGYTQIKVYTYYSNNNIKTEAYVKNNIYDSLYITYYENGKKEEEGVFKNCIYKTNIVEIQTFSCGIAGCSSPIHGVKNGIWKYYHQNGKLHRIENYYCNIKVGQWLYYDSTGKILMQEFYNASRLIQKQVYNLSGNLEIISTRIYFKVKQFEKDPIGKTTYNVSIYQYYENGTLKCLMTKDDNDLLIGKYIEYWQNGFVKKEGEYNEGNKVGKFKEYDENGNLM